MLCIVTTSPTVAGSRTRLNPAVQILAGLKQYVKDLSVRPATNPAEMPPATAHEWMRREPTSATCPPIDRRSGPNSSPLMTRNRRGDLETSSVCRPPVVGTRDPGVRWIQQVGLRLGRASIAVASRYQGMRGGRVDLWQMWPHGAVQIQIHRMQQFDMQQAALRIRTHGGRSRGYRLQRVGFLLVWLGLRAVPTVGGYLPPADASHSPGNVWPHTRSPNVD